MKETRYISSRFCPGIDKMNLEGSLYEIYEREYNIYLERISQMLSSIVLQGDDLDVFDIQEPIPAFFVEGVTLCGKEMIVEIEESIYRGDMYQFMVEAV